MKKGFNWTDAKQRAIEETQKYYQCLARSGNEDLAINHNDWIVDARKNPPVYTKLNAEVSAEIKKIQQKHIDKVNKVWKKKTE
jgi:hypothetical protein